MTNDELEPIASDVRALLDQERAVPDVAPELAAQVQARLADTLGITLAKAAAGGGSAAATASVAAPKAGVLATWSLAKAAPVLVAFALGGAAGSVATLAVVQRELSAAPMGAPHAPTAAPVDQPAMPAAIEQPAPAPVEAGPVTEPPLPEIAARSAPGGSGAQPTAERAISDRELREERQLLERARAALASRHADDALDALQRHTQRFPKGRLAEERDSLRVLALALLGHGDEARAAAERFRKRYPTSLFGSVVDRALETIP